MIRLALRCSVIFVVLAAGLALPAMHSEATSNLAIAVDCDPGMPGVQSSCNFGPVPITVDLVLTNNGPSTQVTAFGFVIDANQGVLNPASGVDTNLDGNPDFQLPPSVDWSCTPAPDPDTNPNPAIASSSIQCSNVSTPPTVANGESIVLASVHYVPVSKATTALTLHNVAVLDDLLADVGSCDPVDTTAADCFGASVTISGDVYVGIPTNPGCGAPPPPYPTGGIFCLTPSDTLVGNGRVALAAATPIGGAFTMTPGQTVEHFAWFEGGCCGYKALSLLTPAGRYVTCGQAFTKVDLPNTPVVGDIQYEALTMLEGTYPTGRVMRIGPAFPSGSYTAYRAYLTLTLISGTLFDVSCAVHREPNPPTGQVLEDWYTATVDLGSNVISAAGVVAFNSSVVNTLGQDIGVSAGTTYTVFSQLKLSLRSSIIGPVLIDPSGYVYESPNTATRIPGAVARLQRWNGSAWVTMDPDADAADMDPDANPEFTNDSGQFKWDVVAGQYRVMVAKTGCTTFTSAPVTIPPPVTDLNIGLTCADADNDGVKDWRETNSLVYYNASNIGTNPADADTDDDGLNDGAELAASTNPLDADTDDDTINDGPDNCRLAANSGQENGDRNFIDNSPPYAVATDDKTWANSDAAGDACDADDDNDGRSDADEGSGAGCAGKVTDPVLRDTDGDQALDGAECALGTDPTSSASFPALTACGANVDPDADRINNRLEFCYYNTSPSAADTDGDGTRDGCEIVSFNGDNVVNSGDQGMLAQGIIGLVPYHANVDVNKDGILNSGDQGLQASLIVPPGQCP